MAIVARKVMAEAQQESKLLHPFFLKCSKSRENMPESVPSSFFTSLPVNENVSSNSTAVLMKAGSGKLTGEIPQADLTGGFDAGLLEIDLNHGRRKRRKSTPPEESDDAIGKNTITLHGPQLGASSNISGLHTCYKSDDQEPELARSVTSSMFPSETTKPGGNFYTSTCAPSLSTSTSNSQLIGVHLPDIPSANLPEKAPASQKLLILDSKTGKISSQENLVWQQSKTSNVRARASQKDKKAKTQIVVMRYGRDAESRSHTSEKIEHLISQVLIPLVDPPTEVQKQRKPSNQACDSATHPFFLGRSRVEDSKPSLVAVVETRLVPQAAKALPKANQMFTTPKPSSPMKRMMHLTRQYSDPSVRQSCKMMKFPGALAPCWPPRAMMHVSGNDAGEMASFLVSPAKFLRKERKSKQSNVEILSNEDVIQLLAAGLNIAEINHELRQVESDKFPTPHACLRLPQKLLESGNKLQRRVRRQVLSHLATCCREELSEDELNTVVDLVVHPAIERVYKSIPTTLTAFERFTYDTQPWVSKYAPSCASQVLQTGKEAFILRDWLLALTIVAVDTGAVNNRSRAASVTSKRSAGKRKRKFRKLDGFVVSSEDEDGDMDEISEPEDDAAPRGSQGLLKRTVIRAGDTSKGREPGKLANAVVISGPSGCGKTAMVYAVAKELGFEIFEINSSSRRSGKDILEKVGDMIQNHQVQRSKQRVADAINDDIAEVSAALAEDLRSGRQGTMNSFFKPKTSTSQSSKPIPKKETERRNVPKPSPKKQKQSLILFEEVDILFDEDKLFWSTVITLIAQSKRPIIMTCNDEALVPLQSLTLHAIIRLNPPPIDIAVDYLLLVTAAEGHAIEREAAMTLFESRKYDLRASLTELNYWCQMGVGSFKSGLDWVYPSWLIVSDVDDQGSKMRVVSDGTYATGMGWLSRNFLDRMDCEVSLDEEVVREVWEGWQIDLPITNFRKTQALTLDSYEAYINSMSAADVFANGRLSTGNQAILDTTLPAMTSKSRDDFITGLEVLEADSIPIFDSTTSSIAFYLKALAGKQMREVGAKSKETRLHCLEQEAIRIITKYGTENKSLSRHDFSLAFDPIAEPERKYNASISSLECSVFDRTTAIIAQDVAPYVRSIVTHDAKLQQQRAALSNLLSEGGRKGKRMRTTRAALSALEGGVRNTTRPDRYFGLSLNSVLVLKTGLQLWQDALAFDMTEQRQMGEDEEVSTSTVSTC